MDQAPPNPTAFADLNGRAAPRAAALTALLLTGSAASLYAEDYVVANAEPTVLPDLEVNESQERALAAPKFSTPLVDTPQTITVIPKEVFDQQAVTTLRDILRNSPGITFQAGEGGTPAGDQMTIRGFSARTDMFIDGVRDLGGYARD